MNLIWTAIPAFLGITAIIVAVVMVVRDLVYGTATSSAATAGVRLQRMPLARDRRPAESMVGQFDQWFADLISQSGISWSPLTAMLVLILAGLAAGGVVFVWSESVVPTILATGAGMVFCLVGLSVVRSRRVRKLQEQLPGSLEMLARAMHAGESMEQAVQLVGEKGPEPLATEFRRCANQLAMGLSLPAVMRALVFRVQLLDMRIFTATLKVHRQAGGNLVLTLERLAAVIRERLNSRRQMAATTAASRASATFLFIMGPMIFTYMFFGQREYMNELLETSIGQSMLILAAVLEVVGLVWISRLLRHSY